MQINSQSSQYYPIVSVDQRSQNSRLPVVYSEVEQFTSVVDESGSDNTTVVTPVAQNTAGQQASFVREFISVERDVPGSRQQAPLLPKALQHYQAIAQINGNNTSGNLVDETV